MCFVSARFSLCIQWPALMHRKLPVPNERHGMAPHKVGFLKLYAFILYFFERLVDAPIMKRHCTAPFLAVMTNLYIIIINFFPMGNTRWICVVNMHSHLGTPLCNGVASLGTGQKCRIEYASFNVSQDSHPNYVPVGFPHHCIQINRHLYLYFVGRAQSNEKGFILYLHLLFFHSFRRARI